WRASNDTHPHGCARYGRLDPRTPAAGKSPHWAIPIRALPAHRHWRLPATREAGRARQRVECGRGGPLDCRPHRSARREGGGMNRPNRNPLTPESLATDGDQGARAKALGPCEAQDTAQTLAVHYLARVAVQAAQVQLDRYALATDEPAPV